MKKWIIFFVTASYFLLGLCVSGWRIGWGPWLIFVMGLGALHFINVPEKYSGSRFPLFRGWSPIGWGLLYCSSFIFFLMIIWSQEFPFVGDHDFQLGQSHGAMQFWAPLLIPLTLMVVFLYRARNKRYFALLAAGAVFIGGLIMRSITQGYPEVYSGNPQFTDYYFFVRYPNAFYLMAVPFNAVWMFFGLDHPINALRMMNTLSLPAWLFILRPLFIKRWPSLSLAPFIAFIFLQKDMVYYLTSAYMEAWPLVLVILAVEHILVFGSEEAWKPILFLGVASCIKEQPFLVIPFAALAVVPISFSWKKQRALFLSVIAVVVPFMTFYKMRQWSGNHRYQAIASWAEVFRSGRPQEFLTRVIEQFQTGTPVLFFVLALLIFFSIKRGPKRRVFFSFLLGSFVQIVFFYTDHVSLFWTGYPRYHLVAIVLFGSVLIKIGEDLLRQRAVRKLATLSIGVAVFNLSTLVPWAAQVAASEQSLNFFEHVDSPVYFPLEELVKRADQEHLLGAVKKLKVIDHIQLLLPSYSLWVLKKAYPRLNDRFELYESRFVDDASFCRCWAEGEAIVAPFVVFSGLSANHAMRAEVERKQSQCLEVLKTSCRKSLVTTSDNEITGAIGIL